MRYKPGLIHPHLSPTKPIDYTMAKKKKNSNPMGKIYTIDPTDSFKKDGSSYKVPKGYGGHAYIVLNTPNKENEVKVVTVSLPPSTQPFD
jgi:hypothetical protein